MSVVSSNPVERANAELEGLMEEFNSLVGGQGDPEPDNSDNNPIVTDPKPDPDPGDNDDSFKQKWLSLQGIVRSKDAQIGQLSNQIEALTSQVQQLMAQSQSANTQQNSPAPAGELTGADLDNLVDSVRGQFGDAFGDAFAKLADVAKKLESKLAPMEQEIQSVKLTTAEEKAEARLTELCPTWRALNNDPKFIAWLEQPAPFSNKKLVDVLNDSYQTGDIVTTAKIFNEFVKAEANVKPAQDPREGMQNPDTRGVGTPQNQGQAKVWYEKDVKAFYKDVNSGKYRGREAEATRIDAEISLAYIEGRVR